MKNLTLKKVAIGLLLAGYSISGAYAANSSITTGIIKGRAPLVNSVNTTASNYTKNSVSVQLYDKNTNLVTQADKVTNGYKIKVYFKVVDQDGDKDQSSATAKTVRFGYNKLKADRTREFTWANPDSVGTDGGDYYAEWTIPQNAVGSNIYYEILANTDYGNPFKAEKYVFGNVFKNNDAGLKENGGGDEPTGTEGSGSDDIPSITHPEIGLDDESYKIELYQISVANGVITYSADKIGVNDSPVVGQLYAPKVTSTEIANADITNQFQFKWNLVDLDKQIIVNQGSTSVANQVSLINGVDAVNAKVPGGTADIVNLYYQIPLNGQVKAAGQTVANLAAGAQGYKLQLVASPAAAPSTN